MVRLMVLALAAILAACSPSEPNAAAAQSAAPTDAAQDIRTHPTSGLQIIDVTVMRGEKPIVFETELAITPAQQQRGMMFRTEMADDEAMLFPSDVPERRSFWMKNTPLALDLIFIGPDGRITNIEGGVPYSTDSIPSDGLAAAVFEVRGGLSAELGIVPGDRVQYTLPE